MILYEYPFNERIRTLLRLEDLFERFMFFVSREHPREHHVALTTLFEIAEVASRADLKADLLKELERQRQILSSYRDNPGIEQTALETALTELEQAAAELHQIQGRIGQYLTENEWLSSIRSRAVIPGGTSKFDLPSYYSWQQKPAAQRQLDIAKWAMQTMPLRDAVSIVLRLARESGQAAKVMATQGTYQQMLSGRSYQLMQVHLPVELGVIPEASANKYMLWVRFTIQGEDPRPHPVETDVPFQLTLCSL